MFAVSIQLAAGCLADGDATTSSSEGDLHGTVTWDYDAVGDFIRIRDDWSEMHCTGTVIARRVVLTAAHCVGFHNAAIGTAGNAQFDLQSYSTGGVEIMAVDGWRVFGTSAGPDDVAILHLTSAVPTRFTPSDIRSTAPHDGDTGTIIGDGIYDCPVSDPHAGHDDNKRRLYNYTWGDTVHGILCGGDSGGPTYVGGRIAQVSSYVDENGNDHFGHVWPHYDQIKDWLALWISCPSC